FVAPWFLYSAVVAALEYRDRTGQGQYIDQSQIEGALQLLGPELMDFFATGRTAMRQGNEDPQLYPHGAYPCAGIDSWVTLSVHDDVDWAALCGVIGRGAWAAEATLRGSEARRAR